MQEASTLRELVRFFAARKKWWLLPIIVLMFVIGTLLVAAQGSVLAPFIYVFF